MSRMRAADLVPYGHPATWPGESRLRPPPRTYLEARGMLERGSLGAPYVLGIDQATSSGWAVVELVRRQPVLHGVAKTAEERRDALKSLRRLPGFRYEYLLVVYEDHSFDKYLPASALISLGESKGEWGALLSIVGHPREQRIMVLPDEWRRVMGASGLDRKSWKKAAKLWASAVTSTPIKSEDEAEAIGIATWGAFDGLYRWASAQLSEQQGATRARSLPR